MLELHQYLGILENDLDGRGASENQKASMSVWIRICGARGDDP
jgi:hypothetical protein